MPTADIRTLYAVSDAVDEGLCMEPGTTVGYHMLTASASRPVNKLKGSDRAWDDASEFDTAKDKSKFRQYEEACDRVRNFYKEQHGASGRP